MSPAAGSRRDPRRRRRPRRRRDAPRPQPLRRGRRRHRQDHRRSCAGSCGSSPPGTCPTRRVSSPSPSPRPPPPSCATASAPSSSGPPAIADRPAVEQRALPRRRPSHRRRRHHHAARLRPAHPRRAPAGGRPAAGLRGRRGDPRRARLRRALAGVRRRPLRRPRARRPTCAAARHARPADGPPARGGPPLRRPVGPGWRPRPSSIRVRRPASTRRRCSPRCARPSTASAPRRGSGDKLADVVEDDVEPALDGYRGGAGHRRPPRAAPHARPGPPPDAGGPRAQGGVGRRQARGARATSRRRPSPRDAQLDALRRHLLGRFLPLVADFTLRWAQERRRRRSRCTSTTCSCWPARCCGSPTARCGDCWPSATASCSSTSSRTPTRSRSSSSSPSPPPTRRGRCRPAGRTSSSAHGRVLVVGDPKQSIYGFRGADITLWNQARARFGDDVVTLSQNFRSVAADPRLGQPGVRRADRRGRRRPPSRRTPPSLPHATTPPTTCPVVAAFGGPAVEGKRAAEIRLDEVSRRRRCRRRAARGAGASATPTSRLLLPTRTPLGPIERALDDADIPYRVESRSLVWEHRRRPRAARRPHRHRGPRRRGRRRRRPALARLRLPRRRARRLPATPAAVGTRPPSPRHRSSCPPTTRSSPAWPGSSDVAPPALVGAGRTSSSPLSCASARLVELTLRPAPSSRPLAPAAVRRRPGPGLRRGRGPVAGRVPRVGGAADRRGRHGGRDRRARARRRRRAHPHGPRLQGPRVPGRACSPGSPPAGGRTGTEGAVTATGPRCGCRSRTGRRSPSPPLVSRPWPARRKQADEDEAMRLLYVAATRARDHLLVSVHHKPSGGGNRTHAQQLYELCEPFGVPRRDRVVGSVQQTCRSCSLRWQRRHRRRLARAAGRARSPPSTRCCNGPGGSSGDVPDVDRLPRRRPGRRARRRQHAAGARARRWRRRRAGRRWGPAPGQRRRGAAPCTACSRSSPLDGVGPIDAVPWSHRSATRMAEAEGADVADVESRACVGAAQRRPRRAPCRAAGCGARCRSRRPSATGSSRASSTCSTRRADGDARRRRLEDRPGPHTGRGRRRPSTATAARAPATRSPSQTATGRAVAEVRFVFCRADGAPADRARHRRTSPTPSRR